MILHKLGRLMFFLGAISLVLVACKTSTLNPSTPSSSSGSSSGSASSEETGTANTGGAGSSGTSMPSGGVSLPGSGGAPGFPSDGGSNSGDKDGSTSGVEDGTADGEWSEAGEDESLDEALEAFENARNKGSGTGDNVEVAVETEFPIILPEYGDGDGIEKNEGEGDSDIYGPQDGNSDNGAKTGAETVAILDRSLEDSYGEFEGMILRERDFVKDRENSRGSRDAGVDGEESVDGGFGSGNGGGDGETRGPITGSGNGNRPEGGDQREGDFEQVAVAGPPPADIPDGTDDDVVARQLREAATRELDPELREKLWDEYRKYKNSASK